MKNISFQARPEELIAIVGPVGSGKSSLILTLLGEIPYKKEGNVKIKGSVFYVSQEPWIFSATLKQNILFGKEYNKKKFDEIIQVCALKEVSKISF